MIYTVDDAKRAYDSGHLIEAIQLLHGQIELLCRELVFLNRANSGPHENFDLAYDSLFEIPLSMAVKVLFVQSILSKSERDRLMRFNSMRNKLIHRLYTEEGLKFGESEFRDWFELGIGLVDAIGTKVHPGGMKT